MKIFIVDDEVFLLCFLLWGLSVEGFECIEELVLYNLVMCICYEVFVIIVFDCMFGDEDSVELLFVIKLFFYVFMVLLLIVVDEVCECVNGLK